MTDEMLVVRHYLKATELNEQSGCALIGLYYLSFSLGSRKLHLFEHLWPLLHHQRLLVGEGRDVIIMLQKQNSEFNQCHKR